MIPFKTQYNKLVNAYLKDQVNPYNGCACFVGNLLNNSMGWVTNKYRKASLHLVISEEDSNSAIYCISRQSDNTYTEKDIFDLEYKFMSICNNKNSLECAKNGSSWQALSKEVQENRLFKAFEETLLLLKQIHESKGEVIEDYTFKKRELV